MSFWGELKRRNVYKVGVAYAIVAWLLIQAAAIIFPHLNLPSWAVTFVIVILIIGFPLALLLAWAYEVTPEGIKRTKEVPLAESITHLTGKKLNYILAGLLLLSFAYIIFDKYYLDRGAVELDMVSTKIEQASVASDVEEGPKTIAVLPFVDLSPDKDQEYFVDGLSEEIISSLTQIPNLGVTGRTSSFTFKGSNKKTQEIANELGVENILEGSVRKSGNSLRITAQLVRASDDLHLWSATYDRELKDIFDIQEDIANSVADKLKLTLEAIKRLGGTDNVEAYELYLVACGQRDETGAGETVTASTSRSLESLDAALALDPKFALAWVTKALAHGYLAVYGSANRAVIEQNEALSAAQKAIEIEPNLADGYIAMGVIKQSKGDLIEAGLALRKALDLHTENAFHIPNHYDNVGYFKKAHELFEEILQNDPLHAMSRAHYMMNLVFLGEIEQAEEEYERGKALIKGQWTQGDIFITYIRISSMNVVSRDKIAYSDPIYDVVKDNLDTPKEGLAELRKLYSDYHDLSEMQITDIAICAAYFDDPEFAMDAIEKGLNIDASGLFKIWLPVMREVRQLPRFKEFVREIGLVDYWNEFGWPDICHQLDNGDFECD